MRNFIQIVESTQPDHEAMFLGGSCGSLALALHRATGWPARASQNHVWVVNPLGNAVDIRGVHEGPDAHLTASDGTSSPYAISDDDADFAYEEAKALVADNPAHFGIGLFESSDASVTPLLILVHPGSACGSANFNIGKNKARLKRFQLTQDLTQWSGDILVVDGELSDELGRYPEYKQAIEGALNRAEKGQRIFACAMNTPGWPNLVAKAIKVLATPDTSISITGAWLHNTDEEGCVNMVEKTMKALGYTPTILESAVDIDGDEIG